MNNLKSLFSLRLVPSLLLRRAVGHVFNAAIFFTAFLFHSSAAHAQQGNSNIAFHPVSLTTPVNSSQEFTSPPSSHSAINTQHAQLIPTKESSNESFSSTFTSPFTSTSTSPFTSTSNSTFNYSLNFPDSVSSRASLLTSIEQYKKNIALTETTEGSYSYLIAQQTESLGDLLQQANDHSGAIEAYEKSLHSMRVNQGLYSDKQLQIIEKLINSQLALNNIAAAHTLHQSLFFLNKRIYTKDDSAYVSAVLTWADWNLDILLKDSSATLHATSLNQYLLTAQNNYIDAIKLIRGTTAHSAKPLLIHAESKLAAINYIANNAGNMSSSLTQAGSSFSSKTINSKTELSYFFNGSNALKRAIAYSLEEPVPDYLNIARQMMSLGDWYLLFNRRAAALLVYENTFELLEATQTNQNDIDAIMSPGMPVSTPGLKTVEMDSREDSFAGYIDVEFTVSKFGIASKPEVIGTSAQAVSPVSSALIQQIRQEKFRPSFIDGSASNHQNVKLRYYYSYN